VGQLLQLLARKASVGCVTSGCSLVIHSSGRGKWGPEHVVLSLNREEIQGTALLGLWLNLLRDMGQGGWD
jgi:hypothetical protein